MTVFESERRSTLTAIGIILVMLIIGLLASAMLGCGPRCALAGAMRCNGQLVEVCGERWTQVADCRETTPGRWTCQAVPDLGVACLPVSP